MTIPVPQKTQASFQVFKTSGNRKSNPGLLFERYIPKIDGDNDKSTALKMVSNESRNIDRTLMNDWGARWKKIAASAHAEIFTATTDWRFVTGLGRKGALEVGFTFHRYGFPMLPGSSVKGLARAFAYLSTGKDESDPDFAAIFGRASQAEDDHSTRAGGAIFFDAFPEKLPELVVDIMNPHYNDYYTSKGAIPPTNWQNPIPVKFLTVKEKTPFGFAVGWRGNLDDESKRLRDLAIEWLKGGLTELGAGAKTSAGYGYFQIGTPASAASMPASAMTATIASSKPSAPAKGLSWQKGKMSKNQRKVIDPAGKEYQVDHFLPQGFTPAARADVEFAIEKLPDGNDYVWVKRLYSAID